MTKKLNFGIIIESSNIPLKNYYSYSWVGTHRNEWCHWWSWALGLGEIASIIPPHIASIIFYSFLPSNPQPYTLVWGLTADGEYSVKSGSMLAQGLQNPNFKKFEFAWFCKLHIPPKKFFFLVKSLSWWVFIQKIDLKM